MISKYYALIEIYRKSFGVHEKNVIIPINKCLLPDEIRVGNVVFYNKYIDTIIIHSILNK